MPIVCPPRAHEIVVRTRDQVRERRMSFGAGVVISGIKHRDGQRPA